MTWRKILVSGKKNTSCTWICCCSVAQSCLTLCDPVNCNMPGFPVLHHLHTWIRRANIVAMSIFCNWSGVSIEYKQHHKNTFYNLHRSKIYRRIYRCSWIKENKVEELVVPDIQTHHKVTIINTMLYWYLIIQID